MDKYLSKEVLWAYVVPFFGTASVLVVSALFGAVSLWTSVPFAVVVAFIAATIVIIPERHVHVMEFLGSYMGTWHSGVHIRIPVIMITRNKIFTGDQIVRLEFDGETMSSDDKIHSLVDVTNDSARVKAEITFRVSDRVAEEGQRDDAYKATYEIGTGEGDYVNSTIAVIETEIRAEFGGKKLEDALVVKEAFINGIRERCGWMKEKWGIEFKKLFIRDIELQEKTKDLRQKRLAADVEKQVTVTVADGKREANELRGVGEGLRIKRTMEKSGINDPEKIAGINLQSDQFDAIKGSTIFITTGSDGNMDLGGVTAKVASVLDNVRGKKPTTGTSK